MNNKEMIGRLKDNAELAWAAYGYFHFLGKQFKDDDLETLKRENNSIITSTDVLDITYKGYEVKDTGWVFDDKLDGDMSPLQAKHFFERYDLLEYYPKDNSKGFHACFKIKKFNN